MKNEPIETDVYKAMKSCVLREYQYPSSKSYGPDWQAACNDFVQDFPDLEDAALELFHSACEDLGIHY